MQNVFTEGTARAAASLGFTRPAAGKTGTTSHHRDSWFAGFTPQLTAVVWVGMDQAPSLATEEGKARIKLTGATSALPIWVSFMKEALAGEPPAPFPVSPHLVQVKIDRRTGKQSTVGCPDEQTVVEKYVSGHEPREMSCEALWPATQTESQI
jgi:penicillin-binding protein 1A